jgi:4-hydroxyacetophenone monooxygenase
VAFASPVRPITASDAELAEALAEAELPALLPALAHLTGDLSLLRDHLRPDPLLIAEPQAGFTPDQQAEIRAIALDVLCRYRDAGCPVPPVPTQEMLSAILAFAVGPGVDVGAYVPLLEEELAVTGEDLRAPGWHVAELAPGRPFSVAIVGAGMSGIVAAYRLSQVGIPYTIYEKNADVGGTWWENTYPGCRVDNPNHNYSYSFAQKHDWPYHYSPQPVLAEYFRECVDAFGLRPHVRFSTEVESMSWSDDDARWTLVVRGPDGGSESVQADAVISAVGQLNRPKYPDIAGRDRFAGPAFHSARWDHSVSLAGERVAVIGTGASASQFIPVIAETAGEVVVFQRTPNWYGPTPEYHDEVPAGLRWLYDHVPFYSQWNRVWIFWRTSDGVLATVTVDPAWEPKDRAVSEASEAARQLLTDYLTAEFADRPDLLAHVIPDYPVAAKRALRDNGIWARTLKRPNVRLVTEKISEITEDAVVTADGVAHGADVIVYGTGFSASKFLTPMRVVGRDGVDLHTQWDGTARAYLGVTVPNMPNFFCMYGPNTNIVINGSIIYFSECETRYLVDCLRVLLAGGHRSLTVRPDVHDAYNEAVAAENRRMALGVSGVNTWYKNDTGTITQNWPFTLLEYWQRTRAADPADYDWR